MGASKFNAYNEVVTTVEPTTTKVYRTILIDGLSKRDTATITTAAVNVDGMKTKKLVLRSTLDVGFSFTTFNHIGNAVTGFQKTGGSKVVGVNPGVVIYPESDVTLMGLNSIGGQIQIVIDSFTGTPTSGQLTFVLEMISL